MTLAPETRTNALDELTKECGSRYVITNREELYAYERDQTLGLSFPFDILVKPGSAEEVAAILKICNRYQIPVTPRGGGSGVTGGALPVRGGVVVSLERLNKILTINVVDAYVTAEAGVVTEDLCVAVEQCGLYFPVAPSSKAYSFVGGNVAENAGSIYSCKYGTTGHYVMNLEVVLPTGEIIWTGANVTKNATGLNLTQLFVGSEGILGVITKVVFKLVPKPATEVLLLAGFESLKAACDTIIAIRQSTLKPAAVELICNNALQLTMNHLNQPLPLVKDGVEVQLLIGLHESGFGELENALELISKIIERHTREEILMADTALDKERLGLLRFSIGQAMTSNGRKYRDIDVCVPLSVLYAYIHEVEAIGTMFDIPVVCFGHALDGNLHTMLIVDERFTQAENEKKTRKAVERIYAYAIANGGVISGEHGIGLLQKKFMDMQFSQHHLALMKGLKQLFDPAGILNPEKVFYLP